LQMWVWVTEEELLFYFTMQCTGKWGLEEWRSTMHLASHNNYCPSSWSLVINHYPPISWEIHHYNCIPCQKYCMYATATIPVVAHLVTSQTQYSHLFLEAYMKPFQTQLSAMVDTHYSLLSYTQKQFCEYWQIRT
jgi:hypothetical protein